MMNRGPQLQNIPIRTSEGARIRGAFFPKPGFIFVDVGFSALEVQFLRRYTPEVFNQPSTQEVNVLEQAETQKSD